MMSKVLRSFALIFIFAAGAAAQTTAFSYQGKLNDGGVPANGTYDIAFKLFADFNGGAQIGATVTKQNVQVVNGIFTVLIDFGDEFGAPFRYLEIGVAPVGSGNFTTLAPRQLVTSTPYSVRSLIAANALNASSLGGVGANQFVVTTDPRMTDERDPRPGSPNYVQNNELATQIGGFNVSGNGTVGGQLRGDMIIAASSFGLNNSRLLHKIGTNNVFLGLNAGFSNSNGTDNTIVGDNSGRNFADPAFNSFFGSGSGELNTTGSGNSYFGYRSGRANIASNGNSFFGSQTGQSTLGGNNSFFGFQSGFLNTDGERNSFFGQDSGRLNTTGSRNLFLGASAGYSNWTGSNNTLVGARADVAGIDLRYATALGAGAIVSADDTIVLGKFAGNYDGTIRPADKVFVPGDLNVQGSLIADGSNLASLNASNLTSGFVPVARGGTGLFSSGAAGNFLRSDGNGWTSSSIQLSDLPDLSGQFIKNTNIQQPLANFNIGGDGTIGGNLLVGSSATVLGSLSVDFNGSFNGTVSAGTVNAGNEFSIGFTRILSAPNNNLFVGEGTGANNSGVFNSFFGRLAGNANAGGTNNSFFGYLSGKNNFSASDNAFFGSASGFTNTSGFSNSFFGSNAGYSNDNGSDNSFFGQGAGSSNISRSYNSYFGSASGNFATGGFNSFFGYKSGFMSGGDSNSFFGTYSGQSNSTGTRNSFFGFSAGDNNVSGTDNTFVGYKAGFANTGSRNTLVGADTNASGTNNTLVGAGAIVLPTNLTNATAVGADAMVTASNALVLGSVNGANGATATVKVGIGTTQPVERLDVRGGNVYVGSAGQGMILKSPNGAVCVLLSVSNAGSLVTTPVACP